MNEAEQQLYTQAFKDGYYKGFVEGNTYLKKVLLSQLEASRKQVPNDLELEVMTVNTTSNQMADHAMKFHAFNEAIELAINIIKAHK